MCVVVYDALDVPILNSDSLLYVDLNGGRRFTVSIMGSAREQLKPWPSGSWASATITPSSITIENRCMPNTVRQHGTNGGGEPTPTQSHSHTVTQPQRQPQPQPRPQARARAQAQTAVHTRFLALRTCSLSGVPNTGALMAMPSSGGNELEGSASMRTAPPAL